MLYKKGLQQIFLLFAILKIVFYEIVIMKYPSEFINWAAVIFLEVQHRRLNFSTFESLQTKVVYYAFVGIF